METEKKKRFNMSNNKTNSLRFFLCSARSLMGCEEEEALEAVVSDVNVAFRVSASFNQTLKLKSLLPGTRQMLNIQRVIDVTHETSPPRKLSFKMLLKCHKKQSLLVNRPQLVPIIVSPTPTVQSMIKNGGNVPRCEKISI